MPDPAAQPVFVTGATGCVGREVVRALARRRIPTLALHRQDIPADLAHLPGVQWLRGDLAKLAELASHLRSSSAVIHTAAATGNATAQTHHDINALATNHLLTLCTQLGIPRFVHVSTVAARYRDQRGYPYAQSKASAEQSLLNAPLNWTIVRPTIVAGHASGAWQALCGLAAKPVVPLPDGGRAMVAPIGADELAEFLVWSLDQPDASRSVIELGGLPRISMRELITAIAATAAGRAPRFVPLPLGLMIAGATILNTLLGGRAPLTPGRLSVFREGASASPHPAVDRWASTARRRATLDDLVADFAPPAGPPSNSPSTRSTAARSSPDAARPAASIDAEARSLAAYLLNLAPDDHTLRRYRAAFAQRVLAAHPNASIDRLTCALAATGPRLAAFADAYASFFLRRGQLRRRLVVLLALLEATDPGEQRLTIRPRRRGSRIIPSPWLRAFIDLALIGLRAGLLTALATLVLLPAHLLLTLTDRFAAPRPPAPRPRAHAPRPLAPGGTP